MLTEPETKTQYLWIEANQEWLKEHNLYKPSSRTREEADIMLRLLIHRCRRIQKQLPLLDTGFRLGAPIVEDFVGKPLSAKADSFSLPGPGEGR